MHAPKLGLVFLLDVRSLRKCRFIWTCASLSWICPGWALMFLCFQTGLLMNPSFLSQVRWAAARRCPRWRVASAWCRSTVVAWRGCTSARTLCPAPTSGPTPPSSPTLESAQVTNVHLFGPAWRDLLHLVKIFLWVQTNAKYMNRSASVEGKESKHGEEILLCSNGTQTFVLTVIIISSWTNTLKLLIHAHVGSTRAACEFRRPSAELCRGACPIDPPARALMLH